MQSNSLIYDYSGCVTMFDTAREEVIGVGNAYPYEVLGYGECIIQKKLEVSLEVEEGDLIYLKMDVSTLTKELVN